MGKKKGAANKLARMSDEERARYLQHRADIEEEARRRKQQLIAVYMKNKLRREEAFARLNLAKINQEWRTVLRNLKCTELRDELRAVEQQFTVALERKQKEITRLLTELDVCEEQYGRMRDAHVLNVSALVGLHGERAEFWRTGYLGDKKELMNTFHTEMAVYKQRKLESRADLECVLYGAEARVEKRLLEAKEAQALRMDGVKSKMLLELQHIAATREAQMADLWQRFQSLLADHLQRTEQQHAEYVALRQRDDADTRLIRQHCAEVRRTTNLIAELRDRADRQRTEAAVHVAELQRYKRLLQERQARRKREMEDGTRAERERMRLLVVQSDAVIATLRALNKKGEQIMNTGVICRRLETERERLLPAIAQGKAAAAGEESGEQTTPNSSSNGTAPPPPLSKEQECAGIFADMHQFWVRFNSASVDCACLAEERAELRRENRRLKDQLKQYLTSVTLADGSGGTAAEKMRPSSMRVERCVSAVTTTTSMRTTPDSGNAEQPQQAEYDGEAAEQRRRRCLRRPVTCIEGNLSQAVRSRSLAVPPRFRSARVFAPSAAAAYAKAAV